MAHKDKGKRQVRLYLSDETIMQVKALTLILGRDDWNQVFDDVAKLGVAYMNSASKLELTEWSDKLQLVDLRAGAQELGLHIVRGRLPVPGDAD